jgi:hypothetical protein
LSCAASPYLPGWWSWLQGPPDGACMRRISAPGPRFRRALHGISRLGAGRSSVRRVQPVRRPLIPPRRSYIAHIYGHWRKRRATLPGPEPLPAEGLDITVPRPRHDRGRAARCRLVGQATAARCPRGSRSPGASWCVFGWCGGYGPALGSSRTHAFRRAPKGCAGDVCRGAMGRAGAAARPCGACADTRSLTAATQGAHAVPYGDRCGRWPS